MRRIGILMLGFLFCFVLAAWPQTQPQWSGHKIITFDAPGAGTGAGQGTIAFAINPSAAKRRSCCASAAFVLGNEQMSRISRKVWATHF
jgi:hypothetical protein